MKKKMFALAIAAVTLLAATPAITAQTDATTCTKKECPARDGKGPQADKMYRPQKMQDFALEGILLTVDQQAKVDAVNAEMDARCQKARAERCQCQANGDSTKCTNPQKRGQGRADIRKDYVGKMKEILTPEQYTTFLENIVFMPQAGPDKAFKRGDGPRGDKARKDGRVRGGKAEKCGKAECPVRDAKKDCKKDDCKKDKSKDSKKDK